MADDERSRIAHLYRRAGFGARAEEIDAAVGRGYAATVESLFDTSPDPAAASSPPPANLQLIAPQPATTAEEKKARSQLRSRQNVALMRWWLNRMTRTERPLVEKMSLFWHGHFATGIDKVTEASYMLSQNEIFRRLGLGNFAALTRAVAKDPAMLVWLDANDNRKGKPNENFARELMELFTIGIGSYTDSDVREAARALTGTRVLRQSGVVTTVPAQTDTSAKTILGTTQAFGFDDTVTFLASRPETASFVSAKLWSRFAYPVQPNDPVVADLSAVFRQTGDLSAVMRVLFLHPQFVSQQARQGLVKQPIEWVVGSLRALGMSADAFEVLGPDPIVYLKNLNQIPFDPPSVGGWPQNGYWLSTATALTRLKFANALTTRVDVSWLTNTPASGRPQALARKLGVDAWSSATASGLARASGPKVQLVIALTSPEYVLA